MSSQENQMKLRTVMNDLGNAEKSPESYRVSGKYNEISYTYEPPGKRG